MTGTWEGEGDVECNTELKNEIGGGEGEGGGELHH